MIPQLKPDIYSCIADHLTIRPAPHDDPATKEIVQNQAGLLSLMKANKVSMNIGPGDSIADITAALRHLRSQAILSLLDRKPVFPALWAQPRPSSDQ